MKGKKMGCAYFANHPVYIFILYVLYVYYYISLQTYSYVIYCASNVECVII